MAENVIYLTEKEWKALAPILQRCTAAAILIPPQVRKHLEERAGDKDLPTWIDYDWGGDPDVWLDVVWSEKSGHVAIDLICAAMEDGPDQTPSEDL
jgi:hypothetical protein